jgi:hypothetical protein
MNTPGDIYKNDDGLCFVPDVKLSFDEIMELMKGNITHQEMLLQHIEILKYLVEQDPKLNSGKLYFTGPVGEA